MNEQERHKVERQAAARMGGRRGGRSRSEAKVAAARQNVAKARLARTAGFMTEPLADGRGKPGECRRLSDWKPSEAMKKVARMTSDVFTREGRREVSAKVAQENELYFAEIVIDDGDEHRTTWRAGQPYASREDARFIANRWARAVHARFYYDRDLRYASQVEFGGNHGA